MWLEEAEAVCEAREPGKDVDRFVEIHNGYLRLPDPVVHCCEIPLFKSERRVMITDTLECQRSYLAEWFWHFSEDCQVEIEGQGVLAVSDGVSVQLSVLKNRVLIDHSYGEVTPAIGWVSRSYGKKVPSSTAVVRLEIHGTTKLVTEIACGEPPQ